MKLSTPIDFASRVRDSFSKQAFMTHIGAELVEVTHGEVAIEIPFSAALTQQHGFLHGGVVTSVLDSACGYAALTTVSADAGVLAVEFKVNLLAPAQGERFRATGRVVRAGRTLVVSTGEFKAIGGDKPIALMQATIMAVRGREGVSD